MAWEKKLNLARAPRGLHDLKRIPLALLQSAVHSRPHAPAPNADSSLPVRTHDLLSKHQVQDFLTFDYFITSYDPTIARIVVRTSPAIADLQLHGTRDPHTFENQPLLGINPSLPARPSFLRSIKEPQTAVITVKSRRSSSSIHSMSDPVQERTLGSQERETLVRRLQEGDSAACADILATRNEYLVRQATRSDASLDSKKALLDTGKASWPQLEQLILEEAAGSGNAPLVRYILHMNPTMILSESVRYRGIRGGVATWTEFVAHEPKIVNVEVGHFGDALGLAVAEKDVKLVRFLLNSGADVKKGNYVGTPALEFARSHGIGEEMCELLVSRGAK